MPYVNPPENVIPGQPLYCHRGTSAGVAEGVIVESHLGARRKSRAIRIIRPVWAQLASLAGRVLDLYDPDRAKEIIRSRGSAELGRLPMPHAAASRRFARGSGAGFGS